MGEPIYFLFIRMFEKNLIGEEEKCLITSNFEMISITDLFIYVMTISHLHKEGEIKLPKLRTHTSKQ